MEKKRGFKERVLKVWFERTKHMHRDGMFAFWQTFQFSHDAGRCVLACLPR
jgi:hypothetical protein